MDVATEKKQKTKTKNKKNEMNCCLGLSQRKEREPMLSLVGCSLP